MISFQLQQAQADHWFAWQRLNGVTRNLITRVHNIPTQLVKNCLYILLKILSYHLLTRKKDNSCANASSKALMSNLIFYTNVDV